MSSSSDDQVLSILSNIKKDLANENAVGEEPSTEDKVKAKPKVEKQKTSIKGLPKSGRFWKTEKERFSTVVKTKGLRNSFEKKTALRIELKRTKELAKQAREEITKKQEQRKERRRENLKRAEENKRKAEVVQVITNTAKLRRMKKKQMRFIEKRDTNKEVQASK